MHNVDLSPVLGPLVQLAGLILMGLVGWALQVLNAWMKAHAKFLDSQTQALVESAFSRALQNGVRIAQQGLAAEAAKHSTFDAKSWVSEQAAQWAIDHSPDYVEQFFGGDETSALEHASEKALAFLPPPAEVVK